MQIEGQLQKERPWALYTVKQLYNYYCNASSLSDWLELMEALLSWMRYSHDAAPLDMSG